MSRWREGLLLAGACLALVSGAAPAEKKKTRENPAHEELRTLRKELVEAVNKNDLDALLTHLDRDVVVTWQNGEVSRGPAQVRDYYNRMMKGPDRIVESVEIDPTVEELTHLYGNTGVAFGHSKDHFRLTDGKEFTIVTQWSATAVKKNGKWLIANFHASANVFDNPILWIAVKRTLFWTGVVALPVGLLLGFLASMFLRRKRGGTHAPGTPNPA
jgi:uncharacterized protein (TIGR02246 family)